MTDPFAGLTGDALLAAYPAIVAAYEAGTRGAQTPLSKLPYPLPS
jgi:hypothetical protein